MFQEQRKNARRSINRVALFYTEAGQLPRSCMLTNISQSGARLYCDIEMPPRFTLVVTGEGTPQRHECRVVWRLGGELGVEFIERAR